MSLDASPRAGLYSRNSMNKAKSIADQERLNASAAREHGWTVARQYSDGSSASPYAKKAREEWRQLLADIDAGQLDVLVLWESSRGDRTAETWLGLLRLCGERGVRVYVTSNDRLYDLAHHGDWQSLAQDGIAAEGESRRTSSRVRRGQVSAAANGRPSHGRTPYGYRRTYDPRTGELTGQEPDPDTAPIVREIFTRLAQNVPVGTIAKDLNDRGVPTLTAQKWYRARITDMARNPAYIGVRRYNGTEAAGNWPALVEAEQFHAVQRILTGPGHKRTSPGQQRHLLSYLATCEPCGANLCHVRGRYKCVDNGCVTVVQGALDEFVTDVVLGWLARPDVYAKWREIGAATDRAVIDARNEVATLQARLEAFRESARRGETSPESLAFMEEGLGADIKAAQKRETAALVPPALRPYLEPGADVRAVWKGATLPARRAVLRALAVVRVGRAARPGSRTFDFWRLGESRWVGDTVSWGVMWREAGVI